MSLSLCSLFIFLFPKFSLNIYESPEYGCKRAKPLTSCLCLGLIKVELNSSKFSLTLKTKLRLDIGLFGEFGSSQFDSSKIF